MKKTVLLWTIILTLVAAGPAAANYIWLDVSGEQTATEGDTITLSVYAHAETEEEADAISCFAVSVGFDDAALGGELTYVSYALNTELFASNTNYYAGEYEEGGSLASSGDSWVYDIGGDGPNWTSVSVDADSDILLFTITFTYTNAEYTWTGDDVWLEFNSALASAVYWDSDVNGDTDIDAARASADFAAVPIPGAALLLGSGLLGLLGIRRKSF